MVKWLQDISHYHCWLLTHLMHEFIQAKFDIWKCDRSGIKTVGLVKFFIQDVSAFLKSGWKLSHHFAILFCKLMEHWHSNQASFVVVLNRVKLVPEIIFEWSIVYIVLVATWEWVISWCWLIFFSNLIVIGSFNSCWIYIFTWYLNKVFLLL